jgi:hypothetical protein
MTAVLLLGDSGVRRHELRERVLLSRPRGPLSRRLFAAAHVVPRVTAENVPGAPADIDWDATLAFRRHIWSWGIGVADAMDTAQRNAGLDPAATRELIRRSAAEALSVGGDLVVGINTDDEEDRDIDLDDVVDAYVRQLHVAEDAGAAVVMMASRHLANRAEAAADYRRVYRRVLSAAGAPVVLHWLGEAFDPRLGGYFGSRNTAEAMATLVTIVAENADRVAGVKMSLLDAEAEVAVRNQLPPGVRMYTGDDFHYVSLIEGDADGHSDALLGAFAAVTPLAAVAVEALSQGDVARYRALLEPTEALSRHVFARPTSSYKAGIAFLSWLNGHQPAFSMVGGLHAARSLPHLSEIVRLADECGALDDSELAAFRWNRLLAVAGID